MYANQPVKFPEGFSFSLDRDGWFMCENKMKSTSGVDIVAAFDRSGTPFMHRCSFGLKPLGANEDPYENCFDVIKHTQRPTLPGEKEEQFTPKPTQKPGGSNVSVTATSSTSKTLQISEITFILIPLF